MAESWWRKKRFTLAEGWWMLMGIETAESWQIIRGNHQPAKCARKRGNQNKWRCRQVAGSGNDSSPLSAGKVLENPENHVPRAFRLFLFLCPVAWSSTPSKGWEGWSSKMLHHFLAILIQNTCINLSWNGGGCSSSRNLPENKLER